MVAGQVCFQPTQLAPAHRGKGSQAVIDDAASPNNRTSDEKRRAMTWAQRLKRVFGIDVETCIHRIHCGDKVKIVVSLKNRSPLHHPRLLREARRAGTGALPPSIARATGCGRVIAFSIGAVAKTRIHPMRPRPHRDASGQAP